MCSSRMPLDIVLFSEKFMNFICEFCREGTPNILLEDVLEIDLEVDKLREIDLEIDNLRDVGVLE